MARRSRKRYGSGASVISDRSGVRYRMSEMVVEPGTGFLVHKSESDGEYSLIEHPLNHLSRYVGTGDPYPTPNARPEQDFENLIVWDTTGRAGLAINTKANLTLLKECGASTSSIYTVVGDAIRSLILEGEISSSATAEGELTQTYLLKGDPAGFPEVYVTFSTEGDVYQTFVVGGVSSSTFTTYAEAYDPFMSGTSSSIYITEADILQTYAPEASVLVSFTSVASLGEGIKAVSSSIYTATGTATVPWDISTAAYTNTNYNLSSFVNPPGAMWMKPDGTRMFTIGSRTDSFYGYDLSTPWDISTASRNSALDNIIGGGSHQGMWFRADGLETYTADASYGYISKYTLTTAWDTSTASLAINLYLGVAPYGVSLSDDGTKLYFITYTDAYTGSDAPCIVEVEMGTPWDLNTASLNCYLDLTSEFSASPDTSVSDMYVGGNGRYLYALDETTIYQYIMSTAWDLSTASYSGKSYYVPQDSACSALSVTDSGTRLYVVGATNDRVYQYDVGE